MSDTEKAFLRLMNNFGKVCEPDNGDLTCYVKLNR